MITDSTYTVHLSYEAHLAAVHLGEKKYSSVGRAIGELVANAFDAGAKRVRIDLRQDELGIVRSVAILDDGSGISRREILERIAVVGVQPEPGSSAAARLGRLGVGRFAVFRIGEISTWSTVAAVGDGTKARSVFKMTTAAPDLLSVLQTEVDFETPTGTTIEIESILESAEPALVPSRLATDLQAQFCSYLLANPERAILVQGNPIDVRSLIESQEREDLQSPAGISDPVTIDHLLLRTSVEASRFPAQILYAGKGRTVATGDPDQPPAPNYLAIVESPYLDRIVLSNREALVDLDPGFAAIEAAALSSVRNFRTRMRAGRSRRFIELARTRDYYPFQRQPQDPVTEVQRAVYDVLLEQVNEHVNVERMSQAQQAVLFKLLQRAMENEDIIEILKEVISLSDVDLERFRRVLERTTLGSIIKLSGEVTARLEFLDILHEIIYGETGKYLKERTQLHRIVEPHCWIFGPQYHLATSDKSFREVIRRHREAAGFADVPDEVITEIDGIEKIPDLFMAAQKDYPAEPKHNHLLVEIKAPSVAVGSKARDQIRKYAEVILDSAEFDKRSVTWDLFVVSAKIGAEIDRDRHQKDLPVGRLWTWENMRVWAFSWSEIIQAARDELQLVRDHLVKTSRELSVSEYLQQNFPDVLAELTMRMAS